ncbi:MAG TPA: hypothetical protein ENK57_03480 [Polyangiaceae bacterium]|nr:hypothetical protein [Polyangiaceae bacterium]
MRATVFWVCGALLFTGCYAQHRVGARPDSGGEVADAGDSDAGATRFAGSWLVDQPAHALYEAIRYSLNVDGRFIEQCSVGLGSESPRVATVTRELDGMRCELVGPWSARTNDELAVEGACDDSIARTVVLAFEWAGDQPRTVTVLKVDGETEGWSHGPFEWRWVACEASPMCDAVCTP